MTNGLLAKRAYLRYGAGSIGTGLCIQLPVQSAKIEP